MNTTAERIKKSAEAAYRRGDRERLTAIYLKAADYCCRMRRRYYQGYDADFENAIMLLEAISGLAKKLDSSTR